MRIVGNPKPKTVVPLAEWDRVDPVRDARLKGVSLSDDPASQRIAQALIGKVEIREGYQGLEISTTSFVGRIDVGPLRIAIRPKLPAMPLTQLLRYAYDLRDLNITEETQAPTTRLGLHDLLITMLAAEVEELLHRGLARRYVPLDDRLENPRGRILVQEIIRQGGVVEARLPCRYFDRRADWHLNQVLRAGVSAAAGMTGDRELRRRLHRLADTFGDVEPKVTLTMTDIDQAERGLTRLTAASASALTIIRLLQDMQGLAFEPVSQLSRIPGFLFDMNMFFQRLLSRFLHENLTTHRIVDEVKIRGLFAYAPGANPKGRSVPKPRPDYALFEGQKLRGYLDAKYRDNWRHGLPADWLYQASIYALASPARVCVLLYASMAEEACDEKIDIQQPISWSNGGPASVIVRPVPLQHLANLLDPNSAFGMVAERRRWAEDLVSLAVRRPGHDAVRGKAPTA